MPTGPPWLYRAPDASAAEKLRSTHRRQHQSNHCERPDTDENRVEIGEIAPTNRRRRNHDFTLKNGFNLS